jgi:hypothetical protein
LEFTWIDASGEVHIADRHSPEGKALAGGVGLIGIITEVKLQLTPPSNVKAISKNLIHDDNIGQDVLGYVKVRMVKGVTTVASARSSYATCMSGAQHQS